MDLCHCAVCDQDRHRAIRRQQVKEHRQRTTDVALDAFVVTGSLALILLGAAVLAYTGWWIWVFA